MKSVHVKSFPPLHVQTYKQTHTNVRREGGRERDRQRQIVKGSGRERNTHRHTHTHTHTYTYRADVMPLAAATDTRSYFTINAHP